MSDDCYIISEDGWKADPLRVIETDKKGKQREKGWVCDLVPKSLIVGRYFAKERYGRPLPKMAERVGELESKVYGHLDRMGFAWK